MPGPCSHHAAPRSAQHWLPSTTRRRPSTGVLAILALPQIRRARPLATANDEAKKAFAELAGEFGWEEKVRGWFTDPAGPGPGSCMTCYMQQPRWPRPRKCQRLSSNC